MPEKAPSPRRAAYLRTVRREKRRVRIWQIALVAGLFAVWELSCRLGLSDGFLVSSPSRMVQTLWRLCASGELWHHAAVSIGETVLGFTAGTVLGTAVAVAMWWSDTAARILDPYLVVLNALPKTALVWGDRIFEKCGIRRDERGDGGKTLEIRGKRRLSARDGDANYQQS